MNAYFPGHDSGKSAKHLHNIGISASVGGLKKNKSTFFQMLKLLRPKISQYVHWKKQLFF